MTRLPTGLFNAQDVRDNILFSTTCLRVAISRNERRIHRRPGGDCLSRSCSIRVWLSACASTSRIMANIKNRTLELFSQSDEWRARLSAQDWPDAGRYPLNLPDRTVAEQVEADLRAGDDPLIITGYAALDRIIRFTASCNSEGPLRIVLGSEPFSSPSANYGVSKASFPKEVEDYWLRHGVSLRLSAMLIDCMERLRAGAIMARYVGGARTRMHAKLYATTAAVTVGSSNFTHSGLDSQIEANARFTAKTDAARHRELRSIAENLWSIGVDYTSELLALLERLLRVVTWQEALARASAELLEGEWAQAYFRGQYLPDEGSLWPSQRQGIAQALYILTRQGSVLIADATGSGKTRMGVNLIGAVADHTLRSQRLRRGKSLMVCPPAVASTWEEESHRAGIHLDVLSQGVLSNERSRRYELMMDALRRAQILCIDEGHNFLNFKSNRTQNLLRNMADHVLVFTATPINRSVVDLLRIADMLGADNLDDDTIAMFKGLLTATNINRTLEQPEIDALREEIKRFTVRRTKRVLNRLIDREPDRYVDRRGRPCRFPKHSPRTYRLNESESDRNLARRIRELADRLRAVAHFQLPIEEPEVLKRRGVSEERYLAGRLSAARKMARYMVMKSLRSSRAALAEHLVGTKQAVAELALQFHKQSETGNVIEALRRIAGRVPENRLSIALPDWLSNEVAHREACEQDRDIYREIYAVLQQMSDGRVQEKAKFLANLVNAHRLVLAFDSRPISLAQIRHNIRDIEPDIRTELATGESMSARHSVLRTFALGSHEENVIGLCSDSLAEGVNLQQASALVHLDVPSVVRIAEQRVGRIDRLDSPHATIEAWWPDDAEEFALSSDERFIERYETVEALLGSNMPLPESMVGVESRPVSTESLIAEFERNAQAGEWDGIQDAFEPVRFLVEGSTALVPESTYEVYRKVTAAVLSRVSVVGGDTAWAFFCVKGGPYGAPRWILFPKPSAAPVTDLEAVCKALRERLGSDTENLPVSKAAVDVLEGFLAQLAKAERALLPRKKLRALDEMDVVLRNVIRQGSQLGQDRIDATKRLLDALDAADPDRQPEWDEVAARWLDLIRPTWFERLKEPRNRPLLLKDIRKDLLNLGATFVDEIINAYREFPAARSPSERISACIVGVRV